MGARRRPRPGVAVLGAVAAMTLVAAIAMSAVAIGTDASPTAAETTASSRSVVVAPATRIVLTPTASPATSQAFSWLAGHPSHSRGEVQIRPAEGGDTRTMDASAVGVVGGNPRQHFSAVVTGLDPATAYEYRVGLEGSWSAWQMFSTADPSETSFQFIYFGDAQLGLDSTWPAVVRQAEATAPDSIGSVHAGDLVDSGDDESQWVNWFTGMGSSAATKNVMAAPGNHEYVGDAELTAWKAAFEYPRNHPVARSNGRSGVPGFTDPQAVEQYAALVEHWADLADETVYFVDYQGVRFITLNATQDETLLTPLDLPACEGEHCPVSDVGALWIRFQSIWLDRALADSPSKWNVVTFHEPVYSASSGRDEPILRAEWVPIFEAHDVDLVLMGHDHVYARGYNNADRTAEDGVTDGPVYIVSNSGAKHYELAAPEADVWSANGATQVRRDSGVTTYQVIDVSEDRLEYRSYLAEKTESSTSDLPVGSLFDHFTVVKSDGGIKRVTEGG